MRYLFLSFLLIFAISCTKNGKMCHLPPPSISFRLIDKNTNADLLANGTISKSQLTAKDETGKSFDVFIQGNDTLKMASVIIGANVGLHNYQVVSPNGTVNFSADVYKTKRCGWAIKSWDVKTDHVKDKRGFMVVNF